MWLWRKETSILMLFPVLLCYILLSADNLVAMDRRFRSLCKMYLHWFWMETLCRLLCWVMERGGGGAILLTRRFWESFVISWFLQTNLWKLKTQANIVILIKKYIESFWVKKMGHSSQMIHFVGVFGGGCNRWMAIRFNFNKCGLLENKVVRTHAHLSTVSVLVFLVSLPLYWRGEPARKESRLDGS